jgi:hypothetical protein
VTTNDEVRAEINALVRRVEMAYQRLSHDARRVFDIECAERLLPCYESRRPGDDRLRRLLELAWTADEAPPGLEELREELYAKSEALHGSEKYEGQIAHRVLRAALAASARLVPGLANSDYFPTSPNEASNVRYLEALIRTGDDSDAADVARRDERRWQAARAEELLEPRRG